jgi:hypothetical protein
MRHITKKTKVFLTGALVFLFAISATAALATSNITGSGTSNYVPKFNSGTSVTQGMVYDNGTNVGIGTTGPGAKFNVYTTTGADGLEINGTNNPAMRFDNAGNVKAYIGLPTNGGNFSNDAAANDLVIRTQTGGKIIFNTNGGGASTIAINGGNVGMGKTNPGYKLDVNGSVNATKICINGSCQSSWPSGGSGSGGATISGTENYIEKVTGPASLGDSHIFDNATDVGINVSSGHFIVNGGSISLNGATAITGQMQITSGNPGAGKVLTSDAGGNTTWQTPASGGGSGGSSQFTTGGSNIYYNNSSGSVGIGTTNPSNGELTVYGRSNGNSSAAIYARTGGGASSLGVVVDGGTIGLVSHGDTYGIQGVGTSNVGASGGSGIGVYGQGGSGAGIYGVGTNSAGVSGHSTAGNGVEGYGPVGVYGSGSNYGVYAAGSNALYAVGNDISVYGDVNRSTRYAAYFSGAGYLGATAWQTPSDRRLKENIKYFADASLNALNLISQLRPASFDYIKGEKNTVGFIAQDVQPIIPGLISTDSTTGMLSMQTTNLVPYLVKGMQEQQAEIAALQAQVAALQAK